MIFQVIISGTGTRKLILNPTRWGQVSEEVDRVLEMYQPDMLVCGGAEGFDELLAFRAYSNSIPYCLYIPNPSYANYYWKKHSLTGVDRSEDFKEMVFHAESVKFICSSIYVDGEHSNFIRNKAMVDVADLMIICSPVTSSGTSHAYKYILDKEVKHVIV